MLTALIALNAAGALPLARQKTFKRHKQVRTQPSLLATDRVQISVLEQTRKKFLDQILRLLSSESLAARQIRREVANKFDRAFRALFVQRAIRLAPPPLCSNEWW